MTDATRAKVRAVAEALSMVTERGVVTCTAKAVRCELRLRRHLAMEHRGRTWQEWSPWEDMPTEAAITTLARAHLPGVVGDDLVFDCKAGAALYAAMERGS